MPLVVVPVVLLVSIAAGGGSITDELPSTLSNICFLFVVFYGPGGFDAASVLLLQFSSAFVSGASLNYHSHRAQRHGRQYPRHADLLASQTYGLAILVAGVRCAVRRLAPDRPRWVQFSTLFVLIAVCFVANAVESESTAKDYERPEMLEIWTATGVGLGSFLAFVSQGAQSDGLVKTLAVIVLLYIPLVASSLPQTDWVVHPKAVDVHAYWHCTNAITGAVVAGACGGTAPFGALGRLLDNRPRAAWATLAAYGTTGIVFLILISTNTEGVPYEWLLPVVFSAVPITALIGAFAETPADYVKTDSLLNAL